MRRRLSPFPYIFFTAVINTVGANSAMAGKKSECTKVSLNRSPISSCCSTKSLQCSHENIAVVWQKPCKTFCADFSCLYPNQSIRLSCKRWEAFYIHRPRNPFFINAVKLMFKNSPIHGAEWSILRDRRFLPRTVIFERIFYTKPHLFMVIQSVVCSLLKNCLTLLLIVHDRQPKSRAVFVLVLTFLNLICCCLPLLFFVNNVGLVWSNLLLFCLDWLKDKIN